MSPRDTNEILHETLLGDAWANARLPAAVFDDDRHYIAFNNAFCALTGYRRQELLNVTVGRELAVDTDADVVASVLRGGRRRGTGKLRRKDGAVVEVSYEVVETTVAGLPYYIALVWPLDGPEPQRGANE